jgi:hypothetical protein
MCLITVIDVGFWYCIGMVVGMACMMIVYRLR